MHRQNNTPFGVTATPLPVATLPLFEWAARKPQDDCNTLPLAARRLARRFGFSPSLARVRAEHAGFNCEVFQ